MTVYIINQTYFRQDNKHSWYPFSNNTHRVYKTREEAVEELQKIYKEMEHDSTIYDLEINVDAAYPYLLYRWKNLEGRQTERFLEVVSREVE